MGASRCPQHKVYSRECADCRAINTQSKQERRRRLRGTPVPERLHGLETTYMDYGCRCSMCSYAMNAAQQRRRSRKRARIEAA